ncbi:MAG: hypothetical protein CMJ29_02820 [Phycisphaerae bacterium]|nr:hypothetical protein [Phycisphaerae bacterium]MAT80562.1 hypothetical protein [Phycisphaerae bacterium]|tara:strand:+ start:849 stop:1589 length:741 start_codon:yes stop_codon:yes gene_type:complete
MIPKRFMLITMTTLAAGTAAMAESTARFVSWSGTEINLASGEFADILSSPGTGFSTADMNAVNAELRKDGIETQGRISILLAETAAGLSVLTMFDDVDVVDPPGTPTIVTSQVTVPQSATWQYNIDAGGTFDVIPIGNEILLSGAFNWNSGIDSEAMAVSNLGEGDSGSFYLNEFEQGGLSPNNTIQMLTMQGGVWTVIESLDFLPAEGGGPEFEYLTFEITQIPGPAGMCLLAIAGLGVTRRRRR